MSLVVKKKITVTGDGYSATLTFSAIAFKDFEKMSKELDDLSVQDAANNTLESFSFIKKTLADRYLDGEFEQEGDKTTITSDNLFELPGDVLVDCFEQLLGKTSPN